MIPLKNTTKVYTHMAREALKVLDQRYTTHKIWGVSCGSVMPVASSGVHTQIHAVHHSNIQWCIDFFITIQTHNNQAHKRMES